MKTSDVRCEMCDFVRLSLLLPHLISHIPHQLFSYFVLRICLRNHNMSYQRTLLFSKRRLV
jgi:hypothetical protein